ncbi:MAG: FHA domain-containing protein [Planctomycetes bacterium]|nr:FHA domain-containing protein [Planctomycetota bacterium]
MKPLQQVCRIEAADQGIFEIRPGETLRVGRHRDNDIVLPDSMVSRFHARIAWDEKVGLPVLFDNGSQNGTQVNDQSIRTAETLADKAQIVIGPFLLKIEIRGVDSDPAVLKDTNELVTLFSDDGPLVEGRLGLGGFKLRAVMEQLETGRRTGTLKLTFPGAAGTVVYCLGRIMSADVPGHGRRTVALERILQLREGDFEFSRELEPQEEAMNLWLSDYLRSRDSSGMQTQRFENRRAMRRESGEPSDEGPTEN